MDDIRSQLDNLKVSLASLRSQYPDDGDFMMAFAGMAEEIEEASCKADDGHDHCLQWLAVRAELDEMLERIGLSR
jgi:hypothetical protein